MSNTPKVKIAVSALGLVLASFATAEANVVLNGGFESYTPGFTNPANGDLQYSPVTNWSSPALDTAGTTTGNMLFLPGTGDTTGSLYYNTGLGGPAIGNFALWGPNTGSANGLPATSPAGGNYLGLDGDSNYNGAVSQTISGLTVGQLYQLGFYWAGAQLAGFNGANTEQLQVSLGSQTQSTAVLNNPTAGFSGWQLQTMTFTPTSSSEVLSFLSLGTPSGVPPFVLLDGVTLTAVPEPPTLTLVGVLAALFGFGAFRRARPRSA